MNGYKINFAANTLTITSAFEKAANDPTSGEFQLLEKIKMSFPNIKIIRKSHRSPKKCNPAKGLTYAHMERYIKVFQNADELLECFEIVKNGAAVQTNKYLYVKRWFLETFPNYNELPDFTAINPTPKICPVTSINAGNRVA